LAEVVVGVESDDLSRKSHWIKWYEVSRFVWKQNLILKRDRSKISSEILSVMNGDLCGTVIYEGCFNINLRLLIVPR
jgi:hypothetical protein